MYLALLVASVEEYLDAIMWRPFLMFSTVIDSSLLHLSQYVCVQCLNYRLCMSALFLAFLRLLVASWCVLSCFFLYSTEI
jgi:hypothetical protein